MKRRAFIASVAGLATGGAAASSADAIAAAELRSGVLVQSYLTGLTSEASWRMAAPGRGDRLRLARAPDHRFDPHSIEARSETGELLGYLPGIHARILAPLLDHGLALEARIVALRQTPRRAMLLDVLFST